MSKVPPVEVSALASEQPPDPELLLKELLRSVETKAYAAGYTKAMRILVLSIGQLDVESRMKLAKCIEDLEDEAKKLAAS